MQNPNITTEKRSVHAEGPPATNASGLGTVRKLSKHRV